MIRTYSELLTFKTFEERFAYLQLSGQVGDKTFGHDRHLNQMLYTSKKWRSTRNNIIVRDEAFDLGCEDRPILERLIVHHLNPITSEDIENDSFCLYDPENLICSMFDTHNAIHYGDLNLVQKTLITRTKNDMTPWLK